MDYALPRLRYNHIIIFVGTKSRFFTLLCELWPCARPVDYFASFPYADTHPTPLTGAGARERNDPTIRRMCTLCTAVKRSVRCNLPCSKRKCASFGASMIQELPPTSEEAFASQKSNPKRDRHASRKARRTRPTPAQHLQQDPQSSTRTCTSLPYPIAINIAIPRSYQAKAEDGQGGN